MNYHIKINQDYWNRLEHFLTLIGRYGFEERI